MQRDEPEFQFNEAAAELAAAVAAFIAGEPERHAAERTGPAFYVETDGGAEVRFSAVDLGGHEARSAEYKPAEELLRVVEIDYTSLREEVMRLWQDYPLDGSDRAAKKKELTRLSEEVRETAELLRETDPLGYFYIVQRLDVDRTALDAAVASEDADLMEAGARLLNILVEPAHAQMRLRNMFEVAFDGMERATQWERFMRLTSTFPSVVNRRYPARRIVGEGDIPLSAGHVEYRVDELDELYQLLLMLYFSQGKQRIVRCACCFGYFIPKTSRPTIYCDRVFDGRRCKDAGPGWKYTAEMDRDAVLRAYDTFRHRRATEYSERLALDSGEDAQERVRAYEEWFRNAREAREAYVAGEIGAAEFLRRIGYDGEAPESEPAKQGKSAWQFKLERDLNFDSWLEYADMMSLDLGAENPHWEIIPAEERRREGQEGHRSLRDQYGKKQEGERTPH